MSQGPQQIKMFGMTQEDLDKMIEDNIIGDRNTFSLNMLAMSMISDIQHSLEFQKGQNSEENARQAMNRVKYVISEAMDCDRARDLEISMLKKANSDLSWEANPDRSGGQFTDEEINSSGELI